jgi:hypothetical protein
MDYGAIAVRSPAEARHFYPNLCVQTGFGAHPASYPMGTGGPYAAAKARQGREASKSYASSNPSAFMACSGTTLHLLHICVHEHA